MPNKKDPVTPEEMQDFGRRLKMWRKFRSLSLVGLAELAGVDYSTISLHERGKYYPPDTVILAYAKALRIRPSLLVDRKVCDVPGVRYKSLDWKLLMGDWRLYTVNEIAAELDTTYQTIHSRLTWLHERGCEVPYTHNQAGTGKRLDPPERRLSPREAVKHSHCKGCRYGMTKGAAMPSGCLYYVYTGKHRPNPVNGQCPAKDTNKRARNAYKGAR